LGTVHPYSEKAVGRVNAPEGEFMKSTAVVARNVVNHHITVVGDPHPYQPTAVPEGGATFAFVLTALIAIALAATKRYRETSN